MIQQNRYEHELYEARRKAWLDENSRRLEYERGLAKSREDGIFMGKVNLLEEFLSLPTTPAEALQAMSTEELQARCNELQSMWTARQGSPPPTS